MRSPILYGVRPLADYQVDRPEVYARQRVQPTGTNRPRAWVAFLMLVLAMVSPKNGIDKRFPVAMPGGNLPLAFRTRQLSPPAPMVLGSRLPGRVGRRR